MRQNPPVTPFLKWAGGKRWLVDQHFSLIPSFTGKYIEPFLGGGSVFFKIRPKEAFLSDSNERLIECYTAMRDHPHLVYSILKEHHLLHCDEYYYHLRSKNYTSDVERAAQFIYLNRTCFNGLYRVNLKGTFNVPRGSKHSVLLGSDNFISSSEALRGSTLRAIDFEEAINEGKEGDLIFIDPPYTVKHNFNGFVKYNDKIFKWADQERLRDTIVRARDRGCVCVVTNAAHKSVVDLYSGIGTITYLKRKSVLSGKNSARGTYDEILVVINP